MLLIRNVAKTNKTPATSINRFNVTTPITSNKSERIKDI